MLRGFIKSALGGGKNTQKKSLESLAPVECYTVLKNIASNESIHLINPFKNQSEECIVSKKTGATEATVAVRLNTYKRHYAERSAIYNAYSPLKSSVLGIHGNGIQYNLGSPAIVKNGVFETGVITLNIPLTLTSYEEFLTHLEIFISAIQKFLPGTELKDGLIWHTARNDNSAHGDSTSEVQEATQQRMYSFLYDGTVDRNDIMLGYSGVTFSEVVLEPEIDEKIQNFLFQVKNKKLLEAKGLSITRGIALFLESGVGKTEIMRAFQSEEDLDVYAIKKSDYDGVFKGVGEKKIQNYLESISDYARESGRHAIVLMDEADGIIRKKSDQNMHRTDIDALNVFLRFLDGLEEQSSVTLIISTNIPKSEIEPALLRSGRIDEILDIKRPSVQSRAKIFLTQIQKYIGPDYSRSVVLDSETLLYTQELAEMTEGFTGADIKKVITFTIKTGILTREGFGTSVNQQYQELLEKIQVKDVQVIPNQMNILGIDAICNAVMQVRQQIDLIKR